MEVMRDRIVYEKSENVLYKIKRKSTRKFEEKNTTFTTIPDLALPILEPANNNIYAGHKNQRKKKEINNW